LDEVERELTLEKARTLGNTGAQLDRVLATLAAIGARKTADRTVEDIAEHRRLRAEAQRLRRNLVLQREACGLRHHQDVDRLYPIPAPLESP
jgi:hypothetical protein